MDQIIYVLSTHSLCTEGVALSRKDRNWKVSGEWPTEWKSSEREQEQDRSAKEGKQDDVETWAEAIEGYLDRHEWREQSVVFLVPAEEIVSRKLSFPFRERRKIQQVLPFELESELLEELGEMRYSSDIRGIDPKSAEVLVLLIGTERVERLRRICLERDLVIRSIDCTAYALYRDLLGNDMPIGARAETLEDPGEEETVRFQVYIGGDEAFVNTIRQGRLDEIRFFPNSLPDLLRKTTDEGGLAGFLHRFASEPGKEEGTASEESQSIMDELSWLCAQFTRHLRGRDYSGKSPISIHGIFAPAVEWDGIRFKLRNFPLPEAEVLKRGAEILDGNSAAMDEELEESFALDMDVLAEASGEEDDRTMETLDELMDEASRRSDTEADEVEEKELDHPPVALEGVTVTQTSLVNLVGRRHWGVLGDIRESLYELHESHPLCLYSDSTLWRRFLHRHRASVTGVVLFGLLLLTGWGSAYWLRNRSLEEEFRRTDQLLRIEISRTFPEKMSESVETVLAELREKIRRQQAVIQVSKTFEERSYSNLEFLRLVSELLDEPGAFRIDQLEYGTERFSMSGSIESYDRLQLLKNGLQEIEQFKDRRLVESNRKIQEGIIFRISIDLD
ncbi:MAG: hypothetical protein VX399_09670 [SAR324 cluster bacterium]|nr:hypothetical protein [SAR324 cluster bacterium]